MNASIEKAKKIKLVILDIDGVLSTGMLYYGEHGETFKPFHVHDGVGIRMLQRAGIAVAIISAKRSEPLIKRLSDLDIQHVYLGHESKLPAYQKLKADLGLKDDEIAYMGDDLPDLPVLTCAGLAATVANGVDEVKQHVDYIAKNKGGKGAVREFCEMLLKAQNKYEGVIKSYLS